MSQPAYDLLVGWAGWNRGDSSGSGGIFHRERRTARGWPDRLTRCGDAVLAGPLRPVERRVGRGEDVLGREAVSGDGDPEAGADGDRLAMPGQQQTSVDILPNPLGQVHGTVEVGARQHEHEFLPTPAAGEIDVADPLFQRLGKLAQDDVPGRMSEAIVDVLEVVEIRDHYGERATEPGDPCELGRREVLAGPTLGE